MCTDPVKDGVCMHVVALSTLFGLQLFHRRYSEPKSSKTYVTKIIRGRKSKKDFDKVLEQMLLSKVFKGVIDFFN